MLLFLLRFAFCVLRRDVCDASQELVRGTAVCVCHFLELAVATAIGEAELQQRLERRRQQQQPQEDEGSVTGVTTDEDGGTGAGHEEYRLRHPVGQVTPDPVWVVEYPLLVPFYSPFGERFCQQKHVYTHVLCKVYTYVLRIHFEVTEVFCFPPILESVV